MGLLMCVVNVWHSGGVFMSVEAVWRLRAVFFYFGARVRVVSRTRSVFGCVEPCSALAK